MGSRIRIRIIIDADPQHCRSRCILTAKNSVSGSTTLTITINYNFFLFAQVAVSCICLFVILPLTLVGTVLGRNLAGTPDHPCRSVQLAGGVHLVRHRRYSAWRVSQQLSILDWLGFYGFVFAKQIPFARACSSVVCLF